MMLGQTQIKFFHLSRKQKQSRCPNWWCIHLRWNLSWQWYTL